MYFIPLATVLFNYIILINIQFICLLKLNSRIIFECIVGWCILMSSLPSTGSTAARCDEQ